MILDIQNLQLDLIGFLIGEVAGIQLGFQLLVAGNLAVEGVVLLPPGGGDLRCRLDQRFLALLDVIVNARHGRQEPGDECGGINKGALDYLGDGLGGGEGGFGGFFGHATSY